RAKQHVQIQQYNDLISRLHMESILIFIGKWFVMLPICIGIVIMPFYLLGAFARAAFKDFRRASRAGITPKHSR
ncbi:hypothetical protein, partial [uncultured Alistipes sp.]|uniref:hypothetical protein n=2 Tax=Bacteroidales TaxID=171549 RepID=UPI00272B4D96